MEILWKFKHAVCGNFVHFMEISAFPDGNSKFESGSTGLMKYRPVNYLCFHCFGAIISVLFGAKV